MPNAVNRQGIVR